MYQDLYIKFSDEAQAQSVLYRIEGAVEANPELNIEANPGYSVPNYRNIGSTNQFRKSSTPRIHQLQFHWMVGM